MAAYVIDGLKIAGLIRAEVAAEVEQFKLATGMTPSLNVILVGNDPRSLVYVRRKREACEEVGISSTLYDACTTQSEVEEVLFRLKNCSLASGILVQLPLPPGISQHTLFDRIDPRKDVDVFHPENVGLLLQGRPRFRPCTPAGIVEMLRRSGIPIAGRKVVVINRSDVVGKPLSSMLIQDCDEYANATVTVCHNRTPHKVLAEITRTADIVVVAVGIPGFLTADMVRHGQTVIDVGTTRLKDSNKLVGDVDFGPVSEIVQAISPVPGGVGPLTVAMLLRNTLQAAKIQASLALQKEESAIKYSCNSPLAS